jgi:hypothetical protein
MQPPLTPMTMTATATTTATTIMSDTLVFR